MATSNRNPSAALIDLYPHLVSSRLIKHPIGWTNKQIEWVMKLSEDGTIRRLDPIERTEMFVPSLLTSRSRGNSPLYLHDTFKYFDGTKAKNNYWKEWRDKHLKYANQIAYPECFLKLISSDVPPISCGLRDDAITRIPKQTKDEIKKFLSACFAIELPDGTYLHEHDASSRFWTLDVILNWQLPAQYRESHVPVYGESSITGDWGVMTPYHAPFGRVIPGAQAGAKLGSIDTSAASYYHNGMVGAYSTPMTIEETFKLRDSIECLASMTGESGTRYISDGNTRIRLWNGRMTERNSMLIAWGEDPVIELLGFDDLDKVDESRTSKIIGIVNGDRASIDEIGDEIHIGKTPVYFLSLCGASGGRISIDDFWVSTTPDIAHKLAAWHENTMLVDENGEKTYPGFFNTLASLNYVKGAKEKGIGTRAMYELGKLKNSILRGYPIPNRLVIQAMNAMKTELELDGTSKTGKKTNGKNRVQLNAKRSPFRTFRAFMEHNGKKFKKGTCIMIDNNSPEYKLGKMLIEVDTAQYLFEQRKGFKTKPGLYPQTKQLIRMCLSNPVNGLASLLKRKSDYECMYGNAAYEDFATLKSYMGHEEKCNFFLGIEAGYAEKLERMKIKTEAEKSSDEEQPDVEASNPAT